MTVPNSTLANLNAAPVGNYLLMNTELPQDDYITAFECYMASGGWVDLDVSLFFKLDF